MAPLTLGLLIGSAPDAFAQDEMPKDEAPSPRRPAPAPPQVQAPAGEAPPAGVMLDEPVAILQGLDKVTARTRRLSVRVGQKVGFGTLSVKVDACRKSPPEDPPESAAFLQIASAAGGDAQPQPVFSGWMFASSPALSAMDHPVYDIWVVDCIADPAAR